MSNSFLRSSSITQVWLDESLVILDTASGRYFSLNRSAARFFLSLEVESSDADLEDLDLEDQTHNLMLEPLLEPFQAGARVMILKMLQNKLIKVNFCAERRERTSISIFNETPIVSCWGTVTSNYLSGS